MEYMLLSTELHEKAKTCASPDKLLALAKREGPSSPRARWKLSQAAVVSSDFHVLRCVNDARLLGIDAVGIAAPPSRDVRRWRYWPCELLALLYDQVRIVLRYPGP